MNTHKELPKWLHNYIFETVGAEERPDPKEFCKNLHSDDAKNKIYLGTYFPRSFAEAFCIHENLFNYAPYLETLQQKERLSILSIGCGTGGDIIGAICAIGKCLPSVKELDVVAFDGNNIAIDYLKELLEQGVLQKRFVITERFVPLPIASIEDLQHFINYMGDGYDIILSFKFVNELMELGVLPRLGFHELASILASKLNDTGLMTLLDVTDKHYGVFQPKNMNEALCNYMQNQKDFKTLLPIPCHFFDQKCHGGSCFSNKRFTGSFTAEDKVAYRVIGRAGFVDALYPVMADDTCYARNVDMWNDPCPKTRGKRGADAFDINC